MAVYESLARHCEIGGLRQGLGGCVAPLYRRRYETPCDHPLTACSYHARLLSVWAAGRTGRTFVEWYDGLTAEVRAAALALPLDAARWERVGVEVRLAWEMRVSTELAVRVLDAADGVLEVWSTTEDGQQGVGVALADVAGLSAALHAAREFVEQQRKPPRR